jgi:hypothetical protein
LRRAATYLALAAVVAIVAPMAFAGSPNDRVTGGGQTLVDGQAAGNTIAFTIQGAGDAVKGQFQYVDRSGGTGQAQDSWHGSPLCLEVSGSAAKAVIQRDDTGTEYELILQDNGEGAAADDDVAALTTDDDPQCGDDDNDDDANTALARGNLQVYDAP